MADATYDSNNIFGRLKKKFDGDAGTDEKAQNLTRYIGGSDRKNHPFVTGYWQFFVELPKMIFGNDSASDETWFHSTAEGFTPPSRTLNKADVPGQGGLGASFVVGQTLNRTFTVTFREYRNVPILSLAERWCSIIDPYMGVSPVSGPNWLPSSYKGIACAVLTRPVHANASVITAEDIEQVFYFDGVFPEAPPYETFAADISGNDLLQHSISFSFDGWPLTRADTTALDYAVNKLSAMDYENTYQSYHGNTSSTVSG